MGPFVLRGFDEALIHAEGTLSLWRSDHATGDRSTSLGRADRWLCDFGFSTSQTAYSVSESGRQRIWSLDDAALLAEAGPREYGCAAAAASSEGWLAFADRRGVVLVGDAPNEVARHALSLGRGVTVVDLAWTPAGQLYLVGATEAEAGASWIWERGDAEPELRSLHSEALSSVVVTESFVTVGMLGLGRGGHNPDLPSPPLFVPSSYVELLASPPALDLDPSVFR